MGVPVIGHGPKFSISHSGCQGKRAQVQGVGAENADGSENDDGDLEESNNDSAVDTKASELVSPGADEHEKGVEANEAHRDTIQLSDGGQTGAPSLAFEIAGLNQIDVAFHDHHFRVFVELVILVSSDFEVGRPVNRAGPDWSSIRVRRLGAVFFHRLH